MHLAHFFRTALMIAVLFAIIGCYSDPAGPQEHAQIVLHAWFSDQGPSLQKTAGIAIIDRIFVTVRKLEYGNDQQPLLSERFIRQPLAIVSRPEGRFAEGSVSVPLPKEVNTFEVRIDAFENIKLAFAGSQVVTIYRNNPQPVVLDITLRPVQ